MRTQDATRYFAVTHSACPNCHGPMRLAAILPTAPSLRTEEIVYYCAACEREFKRASRPMTLSLRSDIEL
jgi:hypothetical protein